MSTMIYRANLWPERWEGGVTVWTDGRRWAACDGYGNCVMDNYSFRDLVIDYDSDDAYLIEVAEDVDNVIAAYVNAPRQEDLCEGEEIDWPAEVEAWWRAVTENA